VHNTPHSFTVKGLLLLSSAVAVATLVACGGGGSSASTGTLQLAMTDSPGCGYDQVNVTVTKIRLHQSATATDSDSGWQEIAVASPTKINLLSLTNGVLQELGSLPMPAGRYEQVRLVLSSAPLANSLVLTGSTNEIALSTPSGQQSGYKLQAHFDVTGNQVADMVLDFDACKSIVRAGNSGTYNLKPVVAVTERLTTQIEGYVDPAIAPNVVVSTRDPIGQLRATVPDSTGKFVIAYLPANTNYTVVLSGTNPSTMPLTTAAITCSSRRLLLDAGALKALLGDGKSLLPIGVAAVEGDFARGDVVSVADENGREVARGLVNYSAQESRKIMRQPSSQIEAILGYVDEPELVHRDNLVILGSL